MRFVFFHRMKVSFVLLAVLLAGFIVFVAVKPVVKAAGSHPILTLSQNANHPSVSVVVKGTGFASSESLNIEFDSAIIGTSTTDVNGIFSAKVTIPGTALPGSHMIQAIGQTSGLLASSKFLVQTNWDMFGFDIHHTHVNPYENVLNAGNVSHLIVDWTASALKTRTGKGIPSSPAVHDGIVYFGSEDGKLYALNAASGATLWTAGSTFYGITTSPTIANGFVYIGDSNGNLYVVSAKTGSTSLTYGTGYAIYSNAEVVNKTIYVGGDTGMSGTATLYAFPTFSGTTSWATPLSTTSGVQSSVVFDNNTLFIGTEDGNFDALNATTGAMVWTYTVGTRIDSSPTISHGIIYVGSIDGKLYAFNEKTGQVLWSTATGGPIFSSPAVSNGIVYVGSHDGKLYAFNALTGALVWAATTPQGSFGISSSPTVANGVVYVGSSNDNIYAFDAGSGTQLWRYKTGGAIDSSPAVADGVVYVGSEDGNLYAFHL